MSEIYWSTDDETYNLDTLEEVIEYLLDDDPYSLVGVKVSYGTAKPFGTDWIDADFVIDEISERAYDEAGEWAEDFPNIKPEAKKELEDLC